MLELDSAPDRGALIARLVDLGVWIKRFGHILHLTPAFVATDADIDRFASAIMRVLDA